MIKLSLILSLLLLFGCAAIPDEQVEVTTSTIRVNGSQCGPTPSARMWLEQMGEKLLSTAMMKVSPTETVIVTVFTAPDGDWTILINGNKGISCIVMWGNRWMMRQKST